MVIIEFIEKISDSRMLLSWRESGRCNYTEQLWTLKKAPHFKICAVSGKRVHRGDRIFCPSGRPLNHDKCILGAEIGTVLSVESIEARYVKDSKNVF